MPFAKRWLPRERLDLALRILKNTDALRDYPVLREKGVSFASRTYGNREGGWV
ncbi:MAG: hypothetical protein J7J22_02550 [Candidatus Verstraetearchaeota archaeon]|nr:hypothetical protein [Candidatus Verstraetearchaeota archaeon]